MNKLTNWPGFKGFLPLTLVSFLFLTGCGRERNVNQEELILGRWEIQQAFRNGQATESLDELYFEFFKDGKMRTNLMGTPETATYELDDSQLSQRDSQMDINYHIENLSDSSLVMTTRLRDYDFRFQLRRSVQEE
jgi:hypothetical protein